MKKRCRKFTIFDAMFMVASVGFGFAWSRHFQDTEAGAESYPGSRMIDLVSPLRLRIEIIDWWIDVLCYCVAVFTVGLLVLRVVGQPRRRLRYLTRFPGAVAGAAVLFIVMLNMLSSAIEVVIGIMTTKDYVSIWQFTYLPFSRHNAGVAVSAAWMQLAMSGRWQREPGWIDGIGFALGLFWIVQVVFAFFVSLSGRLPI